MLTDKILAYNPEDNQGARWLLGSELLRTGDHERAFSVLKEHADEFSPYWYELGLLHFLNGELVKLQLHFVADLRQILTSPGNSVRKSASISSCCMA